MTAASHDTAQDDLPADPVPTVARPDADVGSVPMLHTSLPPVQGDSAGQQQLFSFLYRELHRLAHHQIARHGGGAAATLGVTTLLHEAYLRMSAQEQLSFSNPGQFMAYAARTMRGLIVDHARRRISHKRGGNFDIVRLDTETAETLSAPADILRIDEHLVELEALAPDLALLVDLRFFCGLSFREIADARGCAERTVYRDWDKARLLLGALMSGDVGAAAD